MYIFFDTETTGLPKNYKAPISDSANWPRMVQIAWMVCDEAGETLDSKMFIIKPEGYTIPKEASNVHGISTEKAMAEGVDLTMVLNQFNDAMTKSQAIVAHNISFDETIVGAEFFRKKIEWTIDKKKKYDTMKLSTDFCRIPGRYGYKWPNLNELYFKLFKRHFDGAHDALVDVKACAESFFELKRIRVIKG